MKKFFFHRPALFLCFMASQLSPAFGQEKSFGDDSLSGDDFSKIIATEENDAALREAISGPRFDGIRERVAYQLEFGDLLKMLKGHPHPERVYAQQARLMALDSVLYPYPGQASAEDQAGESEDGRKFYFLNCLHQVKQAGVALDATTLEREAKRELAKMDWDAIKKATERVNQSARVRELSRELCDQLEKALEGHPHPEDVYLHQIKLARFMGRELGGWPEEDNAYFKACVQKLVKLGRPACLSFFEEHIAWPQAAEAWFAIQWPRLKMEEKKRAVMDGLYAIHRWHRHTVDPSGNINLVPYTYFAKATDDPASKGMEGTHPNPDVIFAYAAKLGPAIRKELYEMWMDESQETWKSDMDYDRWVALLRQPGLAPTPREMDQLLKNITEDGELVWSQSKTLLSVYLIQEKDDARFLRLVHRDSPWGDPDYDKRVREVLARTTPQEKQRIRKILGEQLVHKERFYGPTEVALGAGPLRARTEGAHDSPFDDLAYDYFPASQVSFIQSFNDPDLIQQCLRELLQLRKDVEAAAGDPEVWKAVPPRFDNDRAQRPADPDGPARLRRFAREKLTPVIEALETGKPLRVEMPAKKAEAEKP